MDDKFLDLVNALKVLPGVTNKQASNIAYFILHKDESFIKEFMTKIIASRNKLGMCKQCNCLCDSNRLCNICKNPDRYQHSLCIVVNDEDLLKIEKTNSYNGLYFVLNDENNVKTNHFVNNYRLEQLLNLIASKEIKEIIIATDWTTNGEITAAHLKQHIIEKFPHLSLFRLAVGLPINSAINYADETTLKFALKNKFKY